MELEVEERRAKLHSKIDARLAKELQTYQDSKRVRVDTFGLKKKKKITTAGLETVTAGALPT